MSGMSISLSLWNGGWVPPKAPGRGANLTPGAPAATDGTYSGGTITYGSNANDAGSWLATLNPSTTYRLTFSYNLTSGNSLRIQDNSGNQYVTTPLTTDGATHSVDLTFTTASAVPANSELEIVAAGALFGPGVVSDVYLSIS